MYKRLLVAVDGSEQSYKALDHAVAIAEKFGSELILLAVISKLTIPTFASPGLPPGISATIDCFQYQDNMKKFYQDMLTDLKTRLSSKHPDLNVRTILKEGRPSINIVDVAENEECDLIVMGSRGIGCIMGWILGSTSRMVVDSCTKPVLIIK